MKKNIPIVTIIVLSLLSSCSSAPITPTKESENNLSIPKANLITISGKVEFPNFINQDENTINSNASININYPYTNEKNPNKILSTGKVEKDGSFTINTELTPKVGEVFMLYANNGELEKPQLMKTVKTYIQWNGKTWDSITKDKIVIDSKTTVLATMVELMDNSLTLEDSINKITLSKTINPIEDLKKNDKVILRASSITSVENLVLRNIEPNYNPLNYLIYKNGIFSMRDPKKFITVAGGGDGENYPATNVQLYKPNGITFDHDGNMYIAQADTSKISKVDKNTGIITSVVGTTIAGYSGDGGLAINAKLGGFTKIIFNNNGDMYISDSNNNRIRKIDKSTGIITTIAGTGIKGYNGDAIQATQAHLNYPFGIIFDRFDNLYFSDSENHRIRKIDKNTGVITTIVGTGSAGYNGDNIQATQAQLKSPLSIVFDKEDNLYISDLGNSRIRKVDKNTGIISTIAGTGSDGYNGDNIQATQAQLDSFIAIKFDKEDNLYISDLGNNRIRKVDKNTGIISTIVGTGKKDSSGNLISSTKAEIHTVVDIEFDNKKNLYITEINSNKIRKIDNNGIISTFIGNGILDAIPASNTQLLNPTVITFDSLDNLYILDTYNHRIRKVDKTTGIISTVAGNGINTFSEDNVQATKTSLNYPKGIAFDKEDNLYISDTNNHRVRKVDKTTGIISTIAGNGKSGYNGDNTEATNVMLNSPNSIDFDNIGNLYITDYYNSRIRKVDKNTRIITTFLQIDTPTEIKFDVNENIYVSIFDKLKINKINLNSNSSKIFAESSRGYSVDGVQVTNAQLYNFEKISFDLNGNMYITDTENSRIIKVDKNNIITTFTKSSGFKKFQAIAFDSQNEMYFSDGNRIMKTPSIPID